MENLINYILLTTNGTILTKEEKEKDMKSLSGYTPEIPKDGGDFEPFKYEGPVRVNKAVISTVSDPKDATEYYPLGCQKIDIEVEVIGDSEYAKRKLWKRCNLDSETTDKKGKTPTMKLADQLFSAGFEFHDEDSLLAVCEQLVDSELLIKAWSSKIGDRTLQLWNIKGLSTGEEQSQLSSKVSF